MDGLTGRLAIILHNSEDTDKELAKRVLEEIWSSDEFMERAREYCQELGWRSPP